MSSIEIKFWSEEFKAYQNEKECGGRLVVNSDLSVDHITERFQCGTDLVPHFYLDGERVA